MVDQSFELRQRKGIYMYLVFKHTSDTYNYSEKNLDKREIFLLNTDQEKIIFLFAVFGKRNASLKNMIISLKCVVNGQTVKFLKSSLKKDGAVLRCTSLLRQKKFIR